MNPGLRNTLAVLSGILLGGIVNSAIVNIGPSIVPLPEGADISSMETLRDSMHLFTFWNFVPPFLAHAFGTLVGAFLAVKVAVSHHERFAWAIGVFFLLKGIAAAWMIGGSVTFIVVDLVFAYLPMAWLGLKQAGGKSIGTTGAAVLLLAGTLNGCAEPVSTNEAEAPDTPWTTHDVVPNDDGVLRVLILHDMEGLSGQEDWRSYMFGKPEYAGGQEMLAADINAVAEGLFAGGAYEVHVVDGHGSTNPEPDYRDDLKDPRVIRVLRDQPFKPYTDLVLDEGYDAVAVVGMHPKFGSNGFAAHTFTLGTEVFVNGTSITETEVVAFSFGRKGIPVIFASGDQVLADNLSTMPWIEYVTVKDSSGPDSTIARDPIAAREALRMQAQHAIERLDDMQYMRMSSPGVLEVGAHFPGSLAGLEGIPGIEYANDRVIWRGDDFGVLMDAGMETFGAPSFQNASWQTIIANSDQGLAAVLDPLVEQWFDGERQYAARINAPADTASSSEPSLEQKRQYHGAQ